MKAFQFTGAHFRHRTRCDAREVPTHAGSLLGLNRHPSCSQHMQRIAARAARLPPLVAHGFDQLHLGPHPLPTGGTSVGSRCRRRCSGRPAPPAGRRARRALDSNGGRSAAGQRPPTKRAAAFGAAGHRRSSAPAPRNKRRNGWPGARTLGRCTHLLHAAALHHHDAARRIASLVVRDVQTNVASRPAVQQLSSRHQFGAQLRVRFDSGSSSSERRRTSRTPDDPRLPLAADSSRRLALSSASRLQQPPYLLHAPVTSPAGVPAINQSDRLRSTLMVRVQRVALEPCRCRAQPARPRSRPGRQMRTRPRSTSCQPGMYRTARGLAASRQAQQHQNFALLDLEVSARR